MNDLEQAQAAVRAAVQRKLGRSLSELRRANPKLSTGALWAKLETKEGSLLSYAQRLENEALGESQEPASPAPAFSLESLKSLLPQRCEGGFANVIELS
jgi:hypothetical protein